MINTFHIYKYLPSQNEKCDDVKRKSFFLYLLFFPRSLFFLYHGYPSIRFMCSIVYMWEKTDCTGGSLAVKRDTTAAKHIFLDR